MKNLLAVLLITMFAFLVYAEEETVPEIAEGSSTSEAEEALQPVENVEPEEAAAAPEEPAEPEKPAKKSKKSKKTKNSEAVNPNVPGEVNKWMLNLGSNFVGVNHMVDVATNTTIGLPFTTTSLSAGYQISPQIWIMAKFHLFMTLVNDDADGFFLIGPGIRADFIRTDNITFFGEFFLSLGNESKIFLFSPELYIGVDYNVKSYFSIGAFLSFSYQLRAFHIDEKKDPTGTIVLQKEDTITNHCINFILGPRFSVYF
ncbi:MAG TPA: hypothetical protein P5044_02360 [bacterium]|nr:hypothetical protein [bacterium]